MKIQQQKIEKPTAIHVLRNNNTGEQETIKTVVTENILRNNQNLDPKYFYCGSGGIDCHQSDI